MVAAEAGLKRCKYCRRDLPLAHFYVVRPGTTSSRCRDCHGLGERTCTVCGATFIGLCERKACSAACHIAMRPPTFRICQYCGRRFGSIRHLARKFCSRACAYSARRTGHVTVRKTLPKARSAQGLLRYHILAGHVTRPSICEECGAADRPIEGAHYNYDEPLRVRWLCRSCHVRWDRREPKCATVIVAGPGRKSTPACDEVMITEKTPAIAAGVVRGGKK
jgi:hypothetical protein